MGWIGNKDKYAQDSNIVRGDYLIGTPSNGTGTKTFTIESLQGFTEDTLTYQEAQAFITGSSFRAGCFYQITNAGVGLDLIAVQAMSSNSIHQICRVLSDIENLYTYNITTNTLSLYTNAGGGGESNTASSSGGGAELTLPKVGSDLPFRTLTTTTLDIVQEDEVITIDGASAAEGILASSALQPLDNISELTNNVNFVTQFNIDTAVADKADRDGDTLTNTTVNGVVLTTVGTEDLFLDALGNYTVPAGDGENNTTRTDGTGVAITKTKVGAVLPFKGLKALGAQISATDDDITINAASPSQGTKADSAIQPLDNISELTNDVGYGKKDSETFTNSTYNGVNLADNEIATKFLNGAGVYAVPESSGTGESNTSSNSGVGEGLALAKVGVDLPFKSIKTSGGASISSDGTSITINVNSSQYATAAQGVTADTAVQPIDLATVATSGSYNDLSDQPTIPPTAPVDSVNGQVDVVVLEGNDLDWNGTSGTTVKGKFDSVDALILDNANAIDANGDSISALTLLTLTAGEAVVAGDVCVYFTDGKMYKADASAEVSSKGLVGVAMGTFGIDTAGAFKTDSVISSSGLTTGDEYYLSETAGAITNVKPSATGTIVRLIGYALAPTLLMIKPSAIYLENE